MSYRIGLQASTGLWIVVDESSGKVVGRGREPSIAVDRAMSRGMSSEFKDSLVSDAQAQKGSNKQELIETHDNRVVQKDSFGNIIENQPTGPTLKETTVVDPPKPSDDPAAPTKVISNVTVLTKTNTSPPEVEAKVESVRDLETKLTTVTVTDANNNVLYTGSSESVQNQIRAEWGAKSGNTELQERIQVRVMSHERNLDVQQQRYDSLNPSATAASAATTNDPSPPPKIKSETVTTDHGDAVPSGDAKKEENIAGTQSESNIKNGQARAADNPIPPTNPGTVVTPVAIKTAPFLGAGILAPLRANQEDAGDARSGQAADSVTKRYEGEELENNPLHDYASYSYSFILAALTPSEFNDLVRKNIVFYNTGYKPNNVIIASGSRKSIQLPRDPRFEKDFYINEMKFTTVVGMNARSRGSNMAEMQFKIVEPMGVSFFDRLYEMASALGFKNYLEIPYLLIIEFMGYRDDGTPDESSKLKSQTKFLPIRLSKIKLNVTNAGSEYDVVAIPYNHAAFLTSEHGSAQANYQISAKTVGEFFAEIDDSTVVNKHLEDQRELDKRIESLKNVRDLGVDATDADIRNAIAEEKTTHAKKYHNAQSYPQALNAFERQAFTLKQVGAVNTYRFNVDPEIANAKIVEFAKTPSTRAAFGSKDANRQAEKNAENGQDGLFAINAGTSNIDVINLVMKNSSYIKDQIVELGGKSSDDPVALAEEKNKPLKWFKIIPSVKILAYDEKRNVYSKEITYHIKPYLMYNTKSPLVPKSIIKNYMREYKYIFTGDNRDILDLSLEFDTLYFTMATVDKNKWSYLNSSPTSAVDDINVFSKNGISSFQPLKTLVVSSNAPMQSGDASIDTSKGIAVSDLWNSVLGSSRGDMINVSLKIIGDPRFIKQDDVFFTPFENTTNNTLEQSNLIDIQRNVVLFDRNERFVKLTFQTPVDYNDNGLLQTDDQFKTSRFTGIYRVIKIDNVLSKGKFEQTLQIVKVFGQDSDYKQYQKQEMERMLANEPSLYGEDWPKPDARKAESASAETKPTPLTLPGSPTGASINPTISKPVAVANLGTTRLDSDPNTNPNETPPTPGVEDRDRLEALRIQNQAGDPDAITEEQVASNRRLNERLTASFGVPPGSVTPSLEDSTSTTAGG